MEGPNPTTKKCGYLPKQNCDYISKIYVNIYRDDPILRVCFGPKKSGRPCKIPHVDLP